MLTVRPQLNLVLSLSSKTFKSSGDLSEEIIICLFSLYKLLKVWKNSCWLLVVPPKNWISSIIKTSMFLYLFLKLSIALKFVPFSSFFNSSRKSFINCSLVTYKTFLVEFLII